MPPAVTMTTLAPSSWATRALDRPKTTADAGVAGALDYDGVGAGGEVVEAASDAVVDLVAIAGADEAR